MIDNEKEFIFVHVPKTSGSSISRICGFGYSNHNRLNRLIIDSGLDCSKYFKFTFVRNPWDRYISSFFYWKQYTPKRLNRISKSENIKRYTEIKNYYDVVDKYEDPMEFLRHIHDDRTLVKCMNSFRPQSLWLDDRLDFIGRFETRAHDLKLVCGVIDIPYVDQTTNKTKRSDYRAYYTPECVDMLKDIYQSDIDRLNYEYEGK